MADKTIKIYTIVITGADADRGFYPDPYTRGSYLSLAKAQEAMEAAITEEKAELDDRYDAENKGDDFWEMYADGYAASTFARLDILTSELALEEGGMLT